MKVVVLGGGGLTGRCAVRDLAAGGKFTSVVAADLDLELAREAAAAAGGRATAEKLDVRDPGSLRQVLDGAAVCVNAVQYTFNLEVMAGCLAARVPYLDFGGLFHMTRRQLAHDDAFREAGILAIPGLGQVPGVSNVLAVEAARTMDSVDSLVIRDGWRDLTVNGPEISFTWSPSTFLDEMVLPAMVWEGDRFVEQPAMSGAEEYEFPPPVGRTRVYRTLHSEPATLAGSLASKGIRHVEWKEGGPGIEVLRTMALLGLAGQQPVEVRGHPVVPREFTLALLRREKLLGVPPGIVPNDWEYVDLELRGTVGGRAETRHALGRFPPKPEWGLTATEYAVGVCGAIGAELIAAGAISARGVIPPERCVPAAAFREALQARGIVTSISPPEPAMGEWTPLPAPT